LLLWHFWLYTRLAEAMSEIAEADGFYHNGWALLGACINCICQAASATASEAASEATARLLQQRETANPQHPSIEDAEGIASMDICSRSLYNFPHSDSCLLH
jgi:hypothetical protein